MKAQKSKHRIVALLLAVIIMIGSVPMTATAAAAPERSYQEKEVTAYLLSMEKTEPVKCLFYDDMPSIPYIGVMDYLETLFGKEFTFSDSGKGSYTVKSSSGKSMVIDTAADKIRFDEFENFQPDSEADIDENNDVPFIKKPKRIIEGKVNPLELDYAEYHIDLTDVKGMAYFPLTTISDLFAYTSLAAKYLDGSIYIKQGFEKAYYDEKIEHKLEPRSKDLIDYTYNELCFVLDNFFGKPGRSELGQVMVDNGFDELITGTEFNETIKPLLMSENVIDFYIGLVLLDSLLDDGGHTTLAGDYTDALLSDDESDFTAKINSMLDDVNDPKARAVAMTIHGIVQKREIFQTLSALREESYANYESVKTWTDANNSEKVIAQLLMHDDSAIFVFDEFESAMVSPYKWSLDYAKDKGAKNFIIDITQNTGGVNYVVMYMMAIMTGQPNLYLQNTMTGNKMIETGLIDKNLDGKVDEKDDEVDYDFHFALLTTERSFSCGNLLPCMAQEKKIPVIGENSGGGTCYIYKMSFPSAPNYGLSSYSMMLYENGENVEAGAKPDFETVTVDAEGNHDYAKLYDIDAAAKFLDEYYAKVTPVKVHTTSAKSSGMPITTILLIAIPVVVLIAAIIVILIVRKRKKASV